jgi:hypothetical protein
VDVVLGILIAVVGGGAVLVFVYYNARRSFKRLRRDHEMERRAVAGDPRAQEYVRDLPGRNRRRKMRADVREILRDDNNGRPPW